LHEEPLKTANRKSYDEILSAILSHEKFIFKSGNHFLNLRNSRRLSVQR